MSSFENLRSRKLQQETDADVAFAGGPSNGNLELMEFSKLSEEPRGDLKDGGDLQSPSEDDEGGGTAEDQRSLIRATEEDDDSGVDSDGVVREYEVALKHLGFGLFHVLLLFINGIALSSDAIEVLSISFVLPVLNRPEEYGVGDVGEALLSSVIFVGMLFGSYIWGSMADLVGRRATIVLSLSISAIFGFLSAFSPWFWLFVLLRFFSGFGVGGSLPVIFPYTSEFIKNQYRGPFLGVQSMFWMVGRLLCGAFAWAIIPQGSINASLGEFRFHSWRLFIAVSAIPSFIGAFLYFLLPESPRFLLEVGKQEKAMKGLRLAHRINRLFREKKDYPVRTIFLEHVKTSLFTQKDKLKFFIARVIEILKRTAELFKVCYVRITPLLLIVMFCLSFGSYGVTLWFPTYVSQINDARNAEDFQALCNTTVVGGTDAQGLKEYCGCGSTVFSNITIVNTQLHMIKFNEVTFNKVSFRNVSFDQVLFNGTEFIECQFQDSSFTRTLFNATDFSGGLFDSVSFKTSSLCPQSLQDMQVDDFTTLGNVNISGLRADNRTFNTSTFDSLINSDGDNGDSKKESCDLQVQFEEVVCSPFDNRVYRDSFFISASALPGNIASAFAVYFLRRNYWLAFSLFCSTVSSFLLYVSNVEAFVIVMLCIFTAVSTPAWNDSSLLIAELYPTHLRATAAGIHLLMARIGAIIGTNIFGLFIRVNPSVPILLVASVLFVGGVASLGLPKTTRKTLLK